MTNLVVEIMTVLTVVEVVHSRWVLIGNLPVSSFFIVRYVKKYGSINKAMTMVEIMTVLTALEVVHSRWVLIGNLMARRRSIDISASRYPDKPPKTLERYPCRLKRQIRTLVTSFLS